MYIYVYIYIYMRYLDESRSDRVINCIHMYTYVYSRTINVLMHVKSVRTRARSECAYSCTFRVCVLVHVQSVRTRVR